MSVFAWLISIHIIFSSWGVHSPKTADRHSRRWEGGKWAKLLLLIPIASYYWLNHPSLRLPLGSWEDCLSCNWSLVTKWLGTASISPSMLLQMAIFHVYEIYLLMLILAVSKNGMRWLPLYSKHYQSVSPHMWVLNTCNPPAVILMSHIFGSVLYRKLQDSNYIGITSPTDVGNLISASSAFSKSSLYIWKFSVHILWKTSLKDFDHYLASMWNECSCAVVWLFGITLLWDWNENWHLPVPWLLQTFPNLLAHWMQHFDSIIF